jgi:hypothetical protein
MTPFEFKLQLEHTFGFQEANVAWGCVFARQYPSREVQDERGKVK